MKKSYQVAMGGMAAALSLVFMFLTGVFPFADYALPALAGLMLVIIVVEINTKWAIVVYAAVSLLAFFLAPVKESAILYIAFFGYYAVLKSLLEKIPNRILEWAVKLLVFNVALLISALGIVYLLGMDQLIEELTEFGRWGIIGFWALANGVFVLYDIALTRIIAAYLQWFRPRYLKKLK